ncbi:MAG TPA: type II toxin-antitoxin system RelB/DinJ family antitoxin [bacterium]|nr:type II toxin-antitoxin system RelB/DinJ family antitoxin [bacterium]HPN44793.1 type II toxin-antitoxin system RelB/DinJ family antitoxin [bacterium]
MAKTALIQTRIDPEIKNSAQAVLGKLHITMSEAISLFLAQVSLHRGIPFEIKLPNKLTINTMQKSDKGQDLHQAANSDELFQDLDR